MEILLIIIVIMFALIVHNVIIRSKRISDIQKRTENIIDIITYGNSEYSDPAKY